MIRIPSLRRRGGDLPATTGVLVIGASSGIGRATARRMARAGLPVVVAGRDPESLAEVVAECTADGGRATAAVVDVRDEQQVAEAVQAASREFGPGLAVVHAAAVVAYGPFEEIPEEVMTDVVRTDVLGTVSVARASLLAFRAAGGGHLVVIGSLLGDIVTPYMSGYVLSKWAVHGLVRTLQIETRDRADTAVSLVTPGGIDTPVYRQAASVLGRHGAPPPPVLSADDVAARVEQVLHRPRRHTHVGPGNPLAVAGFRLAPALFDTLVTPMMRTLGLGPWTGLEQTPGNVHAARHPAPGKASTDVVAERRTLRRPRVSRTVTAPAETVWAVLADGWSYPDWVVGAHRVRAVDPGWPDAGTSIHHDVGGRLATLSDRTTSAAAEGPYRLLLEAHGWPAGSADVEILVVPDGPSTCTVSFAEDVSGGPGRLVPLPVRQLTVLPRNQETLRRLALLAERRARQG